MEAQIRDIQKQRERLQIELDQVHDQQTGMPPPNSVSYARHHRRTAWDDITSIQSSPNSEALAKREKELRKQIDDLNYQEKLLRWQQK